MMHKFHFMPSLISNFFYIKPMLITALLTHIPYCTPDRFDRQNLKYISATMSWSSRPFRPSSQTRCLAVSHARFKTCSIGCVPVFVLLLSIPFHDRICYFEFLFSTLLLFLVYLWIHPARMHSNCSDIPCIFDLSGAFHPIHRNSR